MKLRWTTRSLRVRLDDLEVAALLTGQVLDAELRWPGGGWRVRLDPQRSGVTGEGGSLMIGLAGKLDTLADAHTEGVRLDGPPRVDVEKDFRPEHLEWR